MERKNALAAVVIMAMLFGGFGLLATSAIGRDGRFESLARQFAGDKDFPAFAATAESAVNEDLDRDHWFIQLFGGVERLMGRRVISDAVEDNTVVKLSTGALNFVNPGSTSEPAACAESNADAMSWLSARLEEDGIPSMFVVAPQKIQEGMDLLPTGVEESGNETADVVLGALQDDGVHCLDLRPLFASEGEWSDWFFTTDHHWKPEAAFAAWQWLASEMETRYGFSTDDSLTDPANWSVETLEDEFLGSQGKRVGSLYAGVDDFSVYRPLFDTDFTYASEFGGFVREGSFNESLCFPERLGADWFEGNPYTYYSGGDYSIATMTDHSNPDGPKVVLVRESFSNALAPFLAISCSELTTIDLRYFEGNLAQEIEGIDPDLVLVLYSSSSTGNETLFRFGQDES